MAFGEMPTSFDRAPEIDPQVEGIANEAFSCLIECNDQLEAADVILRARENALDSDVPYEAIEANLVDKLNGWAAQGASSSVVDTLTWLLT